MNQISLYLKKYETIGFQEQDLKKKIIEIIQKETGVELSNNSIKINDATAVISISGAAKAELFIKRKLIEDQLNDIKTVR